MKRLTKAEEEVMQILWKLKSATVKEIRNFFPDPKPAITTVSTIIRILERKKFVAHKPKGRGYVYYPLIEKEKYSVHFLKRILTDYFEGSFKNLVSFLAQQERIDIKELEDLINELNKKQ